MQARSEYGHRQIKTIKTGTKPMKFPKGWNKMNLKEQEEFLVKRSQEIHAIGDNIRRLLAQVRGGRKVELLTDERPDENLLKDA